MIYYIPTLKNSHSWQARSTNTCELPCLAGLYQHVGVALRAYDNRTKHGFTGRVSVWYHAEFCRDHLHWGEKI